MVLLTTAGLCMHFSSSSSLVTMRHTILGRKLQTGPFTPAQLHLPGQVGTWSDTEGISLVGFGLHKHHYHPSRPELLHRSAATPIL